VVVWSNWRYTIDAAGVLAVDRLLPKARLAVIAHEPIPRRPGDTTTNRHGLLLDPALDRSWRAMDAVFVLGEEARTRVHSRWRPAGPVVVIPHGDEGVLRGDDPIPDADTTDPVVLFFGTWSAYKGIDVLFDAVPEVRRRVPDARVIVAGAVAGVDQAALEARARELGVETRPGYVASADVPALFGAARVVVTPYRRATQSGVIHLAYTFERPVVATSVGDLPAVVQHERTGLLVPPDDPAALADALVRVLSDRPFAERLGAAARRTGEAWVITPAGYGATLEALVRRTLDG
jgi:glycosyltransferase involved in cell wall biosynthesis